MKVLSVDVETNGLYGRPFCIGAICTTSDNGTADVYLGRRPIDGPVDPWVADNVLPALAGIPETFGTYAALLADFAAWFDTHKAGAQVVAHVPVPVEVRLFSDLVTMLGRDPFSGPFPLYDLATRLADVGADPLSADAYRAAHGLTLPPTYEAMSPHNPLYDAAVAEVCWRHAGDRLASNPANQAPSGLFAAEEGQRIIEAVDMHPKRHLLYELAQTTCDLDDEAGVGGGMWWHLQRALAIVDAIPDLRSDSHAAQF